MCSWKNPDYLIDILLYFNNKFKCNKITLLKLQDKIKISTLDCKIYKTK